MRIAKYHHKTYTVPCIQFFSIGIRRERVLAIDPLPQPQMSTENLSSISYSSEESKSTMSIVKNECDSDVCFSMYQDACNIFARKLKSLLWHLLLSLFIHNI